eukprot:TRINITY_DN1865_c3_g1_i1.p1 TRINITY_DN1865_c3_g1~~TRINITY_DN1865_c3_g1_i1.p1  ORF type:complete len:324 (+),score=97.60 TRINITY_DN1865_c3_g1_i1:49-972(+)
MSFLPPDLAEKVEMVTDFTNTFVFDEDTTWLGHRYVALATTLVIYPTTLFILYKIMESRKAFDLKPFLIFHNVVLVVASFIMLSGHVWSVIEAYLLSTTNQLSYQNDASPFTPDLTNYLLCDYDRTFLYGKVGFFVYFFYLSKFYELLDTVLLVLRKKPVTFLHFIHHIITLQVVWGGLYTNYTGIWVCCVSNTLVHCIMYSYYTMSMLGYRAWWKKYLTQLQMIQFIGNIGALWIWYYLNSVTLAASDGVHSCGGEMWIFTAVNATMVLFLVLFYLFFQRTYEKPKAGTSSTAAKKKGRGGSKKVD